MTNEELDEIDKKVQIARKLEKDIKRAELELVELDKVPTVQIAIRGRHINDLFCDRVTPKEIYYLVKAFLISDINNLKDQLNNL